MYNNDFNLGAWLINIRRASQAVTLALFFFLVFHTQKVKELSIPLLNYLLVILTIITIFYIGKYIYSKRKKLERDKIKAILIKISVIGTLSIILCSVLIYNKQFSKPERIDYINNYELSIAEAIFQYEQAKKLYDDMRSFSSIETETKEGAELILKLPSLIIYLNYVLLIISISLVIIAFRGYYKNKDLFKSLFTSAILTTLSSVIFFLLLDFDYKEQFTSYKGGSGFILYYFPTDLTHYYYFISIPQNIFLKLSPHLGIVSSIALNFIVFGIVFILFFVVISFIFGRVFCGWICPFGTIHQIISFIKMKVKGFYENEPFKRKQNLKYGILIVIVMTAIFGVNLSGLLDPISIVTKSTSIFLIPSAQYVVTSTYNHTEEQSTKEQEEERYYGFYSVIADIYRPIKSYLDEYVFYFTDPAESGDNYVPTHFAHFLINGIIFLILIGININTTRFWCRYICPLGALLGVFANKSLMRINVNEHCTACKDCEQFCQGAADVGIKDAFKTSECMYCFNCMDACNQKALDIVWAKPQLPQAIKTSLSKVELAKINIAKIKNKIKEKIGDSKTDKLPIQKLDFGKRRIAKALGYGVGIFILFRSTLWEKRTAHAKLIRPPGSVKEEDFLARCIKCSECMKVCPRNFLHPALLEAGIEGLFTPIAIGKLGYCEHTCRACMEVCPTDAIEKYPLPQKQEIKIGLAIIDKDRCLTYASQTPCIVCEEHCPTSPKAIWTHKKTVERRTGETITLDQINVDPELCIGCGICEYVCPVVDEPAIFITSIQETRSKENRLLLDEEI